MSFKLYKFCQNGIITILCSTFSMFYNLSIAGSISWWLGIIISIAATFIAFVPPLGFFYPVIFGLYILVAVILSFLQHNAFFWLLLVVLILHIFRFVAMLTFVRSNPEKSLQYDEAIRYGIDLE